MLLPVESIIEGNWGGGQQPAEWIDFVLMQRMRWSWEQLQQAPVYVRRYCLDFLGMIAEQEQRETERERRKAERQARG